MIPCLYDNRETQFINNGIGKLSDCISCLVTEKRNGSYELKLTYPVDGIHAEDLSDGNIILAKSSDKGRTQPFRIYKVNTPLDGILTVQARHISYQLNYSTVSPCSVTSTTDDTVLQVFEALLENASEPTPFSFWSDIRSTAHFQMLTPTSFRSCLGGVNGSMLDTFGGEFEWDRYTVKLHKARGADNGVRIVYGKNLIDFNMEKSIEDVITGVHPYWKNPETGAVIELPEKIVKLSKSVPYEKIGILDASEKFEEEPSTDELRKYAGDYLKNTSLTEPKFDVTIDFVKLSEAADYEDVAQAEAVALCDTVHVYVTRLGIEVTAKVTETVYNTLLERYESITLSNSVTSSRNSSLTLSVVTTAQAKSMIAVADNEIKMTVSRIYATKNTLENEYSTTVKVESMISAGDEAVTLAFNKTLESYSTTEQMNAQIKLTEEGITQAYTKKFEDYSTTLEVKSMIELSEEGITLAYTKKLEEYSTTEEVVSMLELSEEGIYMSVSLALEDYTKTDEIRSTFAMDPTSVRITSGLIAFASNTIEIDSDNFKLSSTGTVEATGSFTSGDPDGYQMELDSAQISGFYGGELVGSITMKNTRNWTVDGNAYTYRGMLLDSEDIKLESVLIDLNCEYLNVNYSSNMYYYGSTGTIQVITDVYYDYITDLVRALSIDWTAGVASWISTDIYYVSGVNWQTLRFHKGLLVTSL